MQGYESVKQKSTSVSAATRNVMRANKRSNTLPELRIRKLVHASGLRYRIDTKPERDLNRRADIVFRQAKVAVFIHGCFWHGCTRHFKSPKTNKSFWETKIQRNIQRDKETKEILRKRGWRVIEIWEHQSSESGAKTIVRVVDERSSRFNG